jgi:hypothetical protein
VTPDAFTRNAELHPSDYSAAENRVNYKSTTASLAGYFEMMQTLAAVCITWGFFHAGLYPHQVVAALILVAAQQWRWYTKSKSRSNVATTKAP